MATSRSHCRRAKPGAACHASVTFSVLYHTQFGERIVAVGNDPALGKWRIDNALPLSWTEGNIWKGAAELTLGRVEYKYVLITQNGCVWWQPGSNHVADLERGREVTLSHSLWDVGAEVLSTSHPLSLEEETAQSLEDLRSVLEQATALNRSGLDPTSPELIQADRLVADANNTARNVLKRLN